ncbi:MAG: hypothetical protein ABIK09_11920 [Pseudomonadota bacterium]
MDTTELRERWLELKPRVDSIAKESAILRRLTTRLGSEDGYEALKKLQKELAVLETITLESDGLVDGIRDAAAPVRAWLDTEWARRSTQFAEDLYGFFAEREVTLDGVAPVFEAGPVTLEFDALQDKAQVLYAGEVVLDRIPLAPPRIFREWQRACGLLERGQTPPDIFFSALLDAYREVCAAKGLRPGARVRLPDIHFQLFVARQTAQVRQDPRKGRLKEYPRYQFAYDLAGLLASPAGLIRGGTALTLNVAARSAAESRSASIRMKNEGGGWTYYGDLQVEATGGR